MESKCVTINCYDDGYSKDDDDEFDEVFILTDQDHYLVYKCSHYPNYDLWEFKVADVGVIRLKAFGELNEDVDVCCVTEFIDDPDFIDIIKKEVSVCKRKWPTAAIIIGGITSNKYDPQFIKVAELAGYKMINKKMACWI